MDESDMQCHAPVNPRIWEDTVKPTEMQTPHGFDRCENDWKLWMERAGDRGNPDGLANTKVFAWVD